QKVARIDENKCTYCSACKSACENLAKKSADGMFNAIEIAEIKTENKDISDYKGVWIFAETLRGKLSQTAFELLTLGKKLSDDLGQELCAVIMGDDVKKFTKDLISRGAARVYVIESPQLKNFVDDVYAKALRDLVLKYKPNKFILPASVIGRSVSAKVAILADTGLTADATSIEIDKPSGLMQVTRPTFGGNLMATIVCKNYRPEMSTLRPLTYPPAKENKSLKGEVIEFPFIGTKYISKAEFIDFIKEESGEIDIASAEVIVSGGRGLGKPEGFKLISELAHVLKGAVGSSRSAVDSGWIAYRHQVGLTGRTVKPKIYIACGISGQVQHMAGMSSSDTIIAINKDADAPIMSQADYALEGDLYEVIPELIRELKE
ncbi:MAG TPA: electron transfer flavoprotein subunit alpha/FixB family protein, partial [Elusimicrobiales bacterium]|nr:electron transfer flavoprotein subunit alpha/FixB family protein [Elusimicrobiales bacterium]